MKKKTYQTPEMKVVEMEPVSMICQSMQSTSSNESYEIVTDDVTSGWFN